MATAPTVTEAAPIGTGVRRNALLYSVVGFAGWCVVIVAHGSLPGLVRSAPSEFGFLGRLICLSGDDWGGVRLDCPDIGLESGAPVLTGLPFVMVGVVMERLFGLDPQLSLLLASIVLDLIAFVGGWCLLRSWGVHQWVAPALSVGYQGAISVLSMSSYAGTYWGFVLLPAVIYAYQTTTKRLVDGRGLQRVWAALLLLTVSMAAIFTDGYSFVIAAAFMAILQSARVVLAYPETLPGLVRLGCFAGAQAVAVVAYRAYVPGGASFAGNPIGIFRSMGADLVTLVQPSHYVWLASNFSYAENHSDLWGDGGNAQFNFLGFMVLALAAAALLLRRTRRKALPLVAVVIITGLLAIGPSVKINEERPPLDGPITYEDYLMPEDVASIDLPWGELFTVVPGVSDMRATYRWLVGTQLALLGMAGLALTVLLESPRKPVRAAVPLLIGVALLETAPNMPTIWEKRESNAAVVEGVKDDIAQELRDLVAPDSTVLYVPSGNDYLATYLTPYAGYRSYNVGGDKNNGISRGTWPAPISAAASSPNSDTIAAALAESADAVVVTYFDLRWNAYAFPPTPEQKNAGRRIVEDLRGDSRFTLTDSEYFAIVRLAQSADAVGPP